MRTAQVEIILFRKDVAGEIRYLLFKRNAQKGGFWQPITGGVEEGESIEEGLKRELFEETGFSDLRTIIDLHFQFSFSDDHGGILTEYVYAIELSQGQEPTLSREHTEYRWVSFDEALQLLKWDENKRALRKLKDLIAPAPIPATGDIYRHYKNPDRFYEIIGIGKYSETKEDVVIYRAQYDSPEFGPKAIWVRPLAMFLETVTVDGKEVPRFEKVAR